MWDALWRNGKVATMTAGASAPFGLIERRRGRRRGRPHRLDRRRSRRCRARPRRAPRAVHDLGGRLLTPGLVDPHNHAVYYGDALGDFELLTQGGTRADMIAAGGGVGGLVRQTRAATDEQIYAASAARVAKLIASGMTTLESKSGAGLDLETELRCLRIGARARAEAAGAHRHHLPGRPRPRPGVPRPARRLHRSSLPGRPARRREARASWTRWTASATPPGFSHAQITRLFETARAHGLPVKLHAEQYRDFRAADLVAQFKGLSADHLEFAGEATIRAMAEADTVATLLPGAHWTMAETQRPPVALFRPLRASRWRSPPTATRSARTPARRP